MPPLSEVVLDASALLALVQGEPGGDQVGPLENDPISSPKINMYETRFYLTSAWSAGRYVQVRYRGERGYDSLTKDQAGRYLQWLRSGNIGTHRDAVRFFEGEGQADA